MKIKRIDDLYLRVTPDEGKTLVVGNDDAKYSVVDIKAAELGRVREVEK